ncbi:MAG: transposase [Bacteroidetes bacterium]|nr:transposase [Bacteroidota bacterium]
MKIFYQRHLPHYQPPGSTFFVTFRLAGSLPLYVIQNLKTEHEKQLKLISGIQNQKEKRERYRDYQTSYFEKFDSILGNYKNSVSWLKQTQVAEKVKETIHYYDGKAYDLIAYTIMPNHVHMVFAPIEENVGRFSESPTSGRNGVSTYIVAKILQDLKKYTAVKCNKILNRSGAFWQHESYDHVVRDEDELSRIIEYVLNNPVKAGLVDKWNDWKWSYCKFLID